jgi:5-methylcytosine-specific restriction endonuclease McrA
MEFKAGAYMSRELALPKPHREHLKDDEYRKFIESIFRRDGWRCRNPFCGSMKNLTPHHLTKRSQLGGDTPGNVITLCIVCHEKAEQNEIKIEVQDVVVRFIFPGQKTNNREGR